MPTKKRTSKKLPAVKNESSTKQNGLQDALFPQSSILGFNTGSFGTEVNQVDTLIINLRYYIVSNFRQILSQAYIEHGIIQNVVTVPVDDAFRGDIEVKSKELSPEQLEQLKVEREREGDLAVLSEAHYWNRLYGGAGILILTDQDPATPINIKAIGPDTPLEYRAVDMWELFYDQINLDGTVLGQDPKFEYYNYYGMRVHKSRVMRLKGVVAPSFIRPRLRGWGLSIVEVLINSVNQYLKTKNIVFEVLDEFKVDYYQFKNLTQTLVSADGTNAVQRRIALANAGKNYQNAVVLDADDKFEQKQLSFSGLADIPKESRMQIAADMRMPISKIFGISSTGFSSGEDDIENYHSMIEGSIRAKAKFEIIKMIELRCQKLFGFVPKDLSIDYKPLRILSSEKDEEVKTKKFNRLLAARQAGEMSSQEFKEACNKDNLLIIQVNPDLDTSRTNTSNGSGVKGVSNPDGDQQYDKKSATTSKEAPQAKS